ncbi:hypothetical protein [Actinoplanes sp. NPDC049681]|uniref:hypothetical protein n=1 Tax=Actinoplanes sp. NPDC049681 TaxID=3363905 RepID=UPI003788A77F
MEQSRPERRAHWTELLPQGDAEHTSHPAPPERKAGSPRLRIVTMIVAGAGTLAVLMIGAVSGWSSDASAPPLAHYQPAPTIAYAGPSLVASAGRAPSGPTSRAPAAPASPASAAPTSRAPGRPASPRPVKVTSAAPAPFSALAGFRCPETDSSGYVEHVGTDGWYLVTGGGWAGDGCRGHMVAMPMSGSSDDPRNVMLWWFRMPSREQCGVEVYVPRTGNVRDAAGTPATYHVYGTADGSGSRIGQFTIDQVRDQGRWVSAGKFPARSGRLSVRLTSRGESDIRGARLGGSAVRISC